MRPLSMSHVPSIDTIDQTIESQYGALVTLRRHLHAHPELSGREVETTRLLAARLDALGYEVRVREAGVGIIADLTPEGFDPRIHRTVAVRADMDALPIAEDNDAPYRSQHPGVMHACGHDVHMSCAMGAAMAFAAVRDELPGRLRVIFQHAEEVTPSGAPEMIASGALDGVAAIIALHCDPERPLGEVGVRAGALTASFDTFEFTILGEGGHGARPHQTIDPIFIGTQLANALYLSTSRNLDAREAVVLSIGRFEAGHAPNAIPERAEFCGTVRTISARTRAEVEPMLRRIAQGITQAHRADFELHMRHGSPPVLNDPHVTDVLEAAAEDVLGAGRIERIALPSMGSEDFAHYLQHIPGAMFRLGTAQADRPVYRLHSSRFDIDERAIALGARILARAAVRLLAEG